MVEHEVDNRSTIYKAFLVRMWQDTPDSPWRASAQSVLTGEVVRFATFAALLSYLRGHTASHESAADPMQAD